MKQSCNVMRAVGGNMQVVKNPLFVGKTDLARAKIKHHGRVYRYIIFKKIVDLENDFMCTL